MGFTLEIQSGQDSSRAVEIQHGQVIEVGRGPSAGLIVPDDPTLSDIHFLLEGGEISCHLCDLSEHGGTFVNGTRVTQAILHPGDRIDAGRTTFLLRVGSDVTPPSPAPSADVPAPPAGPPALPDSERHADPLLALRARTWPLFAVLDAARDPMVLALLFQAKERWQSLYEGIEGERLAAAAPYLVGLPKESSLLETLARDAWGKSWGVYLACDQPFEAVRKHLRRFLLVTDEEGEELYFRYYDPRVLRVYLPTCTPEETREFFGPIRDLLMEAEDPATLLIFSRDGPATTPAEVSLAAVPGSVP
jgi:pSer/pThr/pTyr-binding forkhead associated (FHA) protein